MMENTMKNSDTRPLPEGWIQNYEPSKSLWYYVQINTIPPKVTFTHPADAMLPKRKKAYTLPVDAKHEVEMPEPEMEPLQEKTVPPAAAPRGRTLAQQLYASSKIEAASPMISTDGLGNLSTAPLPDVGQSFNSSSVMQASPASLPPLSDPTLTSTVKRPLPMTNIAPPHLQFLNQRLSYSDRPNTANVPSPTANSSSNTSAGLYRSGSVISTQSTSSNESTRPHRRAQSYVASSHSAGPRPAPNLVTTAKPPPGHVHSQILPGQTTVSPPSSSSSGPGSPPITIGYTPGSPNSINTTSTTPSSMIFPQAVSLPSSPPPPPPKPQFSTMATTTNAGQSNGKKLAMTAGKIVGKIAANATLQVAGNYISQATGISADFITNIGGLLLDSKFTNMLKAAFSKNSSVTEADLQAVMQGQPNANYQAVIDALIKQQQQQQQQIMAQTQFYNGVQFQRPNQSAVDYRTLIAEIQRLQQVAQSQQAQYVMAQQQLGSQQATIAQLQAQAQHQQQQAGQAAVQMRPQHTGMSAQQPAHLQSEQTGSHQQPAYQAQPNLSQPPSVTAQQQQQQQQEQDNAQKFQEALQQQIQAASAQQQQQQDQLTAYLQQQQQQQQAAIQQLLQQQQQQQAAITSQVNSQIAQQQQATNQLIQNAIQPQKENPYAQVVDQIIQSVTQQQQQQQQSQDNPYSQIYNQYLQNSIPMLCSNRHSSRLSPI
ncbi:hypothetical protein CPC08DRAFT_314656 [Agrocybe pediades]|nr:hypothetical protein CPC08DRAFT_314656 [Agrocybe pediades]